MRPRRKSLFLVFLSFVLFGVGCSSRNSALPTFVERAASHHTTNELPRAGWVLPEAAGQKLLYVDNFIDVEVYKFGNELQQVGILTDHLGSSTSLFVDKNLNLYVVNSTPSEDWEVVEFPPGETQASTIYQGCSPSGCSSYPQPRAESVVVGANGVVYVGTTAGIYKFEQGNPYAFQLLTDDTRALALALDSAGNLYATDNGDVMRYAPGATSGTPMRLHGLDFAMNLAIAPNNDMVVGTSVSLGQTFEVLYKPGHRSAFRVLDPVPSWVAQIVFDSLGTLYATSPVRALVGSIVMNRNGHMNWARVLRSRRLYPTGVAISPPAPL